MVWITSYLKIIFMTSFDHKTLCIHIGSYKTGSSYFQNMCFENRELLESKGVIYPKIAVHYKASIGHAHRKLLRNDNLQKLLTKISNSKAPKKFLISWEGLSHPKYFKFLESDIFSSQQNLTVKIVFVCRSYVDFMSSLYKQFSQSRQLNDDFITYLNKENQPHNWGKIIDKWSNLVGPENIKLLNYDNIKYDLSANILQAFDIDTKLTAPKGRIDNLSQSSVTMKVCRMLVDKGVNKQQISHIASHLQKIDTKHPEFQNLTEFTSSDIQAIKTKFDHEMSSIQNTIPLDFPVEDLLISKTQNYNAETLHASTQTAIRELLGIDHEEIHSVKTQLESLIR